MVNVIVWIFMILRCWPKNNLFFLCLLLVGAPNLMGTDDEDGDEAIEPSYFLPADLFDDPKEDLFQAVIDGNEAELKRLLEMGVPANRFDALGNLPLHVAAALGRVKILRILLDHGQDVNALNRFGETALHLTIADNRVRAFQFLLDRGLERALVRLDRYGRDIFQIAQDHRAWDIHEAMKIPFWFIWILPGISQMPDA